MKQNRDMFYSDFNYGGSTFPNPNMGPNVYNGNYNMMAAGPNVVAPNNMNYPNGMMPYNDNNIESRLDKLERQVKRLETKISNLEINSNTPDVEVNSSMYMI